jgi:hypothetical protein
MMEVLRKLWRRHMVAPFPKDRPRECFDCNLGTCLDCKFLAEFKNKT